MPQVSAAVLRSIEHQRKRKYPTRRSTILLPARRLAKLRGRQIKSGDRYRRSHRCRSSQKPASSQSFIDLGIPNESQFPAVGMRDIFTIVIEIRVKLKSQSRRRYCVTTPFWGWTLTPKSAPRFRWPEL